MHWCYRSLPGTKHESGSNSTSTFSFTYYKPIVHLQTRLLCVLLNHRLCSRQGKTENTVNASVDFKQSACQIISSLICTLIGILWYWF